MAARRKSCIKKDQTHELHQCPAYIKAEGALEDTNDQQAIHEGPGILADLFLVKSRH
jgi:hypothetical protein